MYTYIEDQFIEENKSLTWPNDLNYHLDKVV